jgi:hypothetical protein
MENDMKQASEASATNHQNKDWLFNTKNYSVRYIHGARIRICCIYYQDQEIPIGCASTITDGKNSTRKEIISLALRRASEKIIQRKLTNLKELFT